MNRLRFWIKGGIIKMADGQLQLTAFGAYLLADILGRTAWAIASFNKPAQLAPFIGELRFYENVRYFEDIGREARQWHDTLSSYKGQEVSVDAQNDLRVAITRWDTLAREWLQDLYLVTPVTKMEPKHLMKGIEGFLVQEHFSFLEPIEVSDLNEACKCILIGSATAAEHMALRAAENLLRRWHKHKTGKVLQRKTWGTVLDKLVQEYPENARPKEIDLLGCLKLRRDEVAHPERVSSLIDAEATLLQVCSLIQGIAPVLTKTDENQINVV